MRTRFVSIFDAFQPSVTVQNVCVPPGAQFISAQHSRAKASRHESGSCASILPEQPFCNTMVQNCWKPSNADAAMAQKPNRQNNHRFLSPRRGVKGFRPPHKPPLSLPLSPPLRPPLSFPRKSPPLKPPLSPPLKLPLKPLFEAPLKPPLKPLKPPLKAPLKPP